MFWPNIYLLAAGQQEAFESEERFLAKILNRAVQLIVRHLSCMSGLFVEPLKVCQRFYRLGVTVTLCDRTFKLALRD